MSPRVKKPEPKKKNPGARLLDSSAVVQIFERWKKGNPHPRTELDYTNPYTLMVAVTLSAQATDISVNKATKALFKKVDTPEKMLGLGEENLRDYIKTIGLYNAKAKNVIKQAQQLVDDFGGEVPRTRDELQSLAGVGRKTANVILNEAFGQSTIAVDTHIFRVSQRLGLAYGKTPDDIEHGLEKIIPEAYKRHAHHWILLHGRYICKARKPECTRCELIDQCLFPGKVLD